MIAVLCAEQRLGHHEYSLHLGCAKGILCWQSGVQWQGIIIWTPVHVKGCKSNINLNKNVCIFCMTFMIIAYILHIIFLFLYHLPWHTHASVLPYLSSCLFHKQGWACQCLCLLLSIIFCWVWKTIPDLAIQLPKVVLAGGWRITLPCLSHKLHGTSLFWYPQDIELLLGCLNLLLGFQDYSWRLQVILEHSLIWRECTFLYYINIQLHIPNIFTSTLYIFVTLIPRTTHLLTKFHQFEYSHWLTL